MNTLDSIKTTGVEEVAQEEPVENGDYSFPGFYETRELTLYLIDRPTFGLPPSL
jgi:hypothetical protein